VRPWILISTSMLPKQPPQTDARRRLPVEAEQVSLDLALFGEMADARVEPALLVGAVQQVDVEHQREADRVGGANGGEHADDGALHVGRATPVQPVAAPREAEGVHRPAIAGRDGIDVEIDRADRAAGPAARHQVHPVAVGGSARGAPKRLRHQHPVAGEAQRSDHAVEHVGELRVAATGREGGVDRDHPIEGLEHPGLVAIDLFQRLFQETGSVVSAIRHCRLHLFSI